ncbi:mechanosensitive ion channel family protein [Aestuariirhabdus sp. Z084]|uniref:mechanosensitive ion channel family protein n=1 Tax=Aestuariirhabdus haliotis TaxID=2918751 RepID=UPI00201B41C6|nr:mechanosensitive ion channel family protein [Aestuariirhabdus haliotis]MCL6415986.1 mechanosensitive ion channel family protein [Aestuariirhabdus haliotis]MCL6419981.1 mechanosensitive ion channel family protein [Aestuariirhabdus haliotis]
MMTSPMRMLLLGCLLAVPLLNPLYAATEADESLTQERIEETAVPTSPPAMKGMVVSVNHRVDRFVEEFGDLKLALHQLPSQYHQMVNTLLSDGETASGLLMMLVLMLAVGIGVEKLLAFKFAPLTRKMEAQQESRWYIRLQYMFLGILFRFASLLAFALSALAVPAIIYDSGAPPRLLLVSVLTVVVAVRVMTIVAGAILAPWAKGIRPLPLECPQARRLYYWVLLITIIYSVTSHGSGLWVALGLQHELVLASVVLGGLIMALTIVLMMWAERLSINQMFAEGLSPNISPARQMLAQSWPVLATAWILLLWGIWGFNVFIENTAVVEKISLAWWVTILFPVLDRLVYALLSRVVSLPMLQAGRFPQRAPRVVAILLNGFRLILVAATLITLSEAWGMGSFQMMKSDGGQMVLDRLGDVLVILLLAYVVWEVVRTLIEQRMPEEDEDADAAPEGEGGAGGATRTETLLPLLRSFIFAILVVVVVLTILHSLGIQIGPLVAGAGVVGIAVGFGAQKLVQDVISGIFFLLDDAFRRGEYIETGGLRGTVEKISMRSMRLRHHLGAVQTIPYGEIATVKNLSRDWITMKLELRLPYDTDIEKVRKIIKKVGQEMLTDEEMGPSFILPLKSQGVMRVEESALIVRMKFTSKPGEQWIIRREAYRRVRDALQAAGITFAHREVRVRLPEELEHEHEDSAMNSQAAANSASGSDSVSPDSAPQKSSAASGEQQGSADEQASRREKLVEQVTAAATTAVIASELARQQKLDGAEDGGDEM